MSKSIAVIGYSGHAYVVIDSIYSQGNRVTGYFENERKTLNPYGLEYLGVENQIGLNVGKWIVAIGDNLTRKKIIERYRSLHRGLESVSHRSSIIGSNVTIGKGCFIGVNAVINACSKVGIGSIINTDAIVEHECTLSDYVHIAPGAVLAGNVTVGEGSFIGANAVVKQGVSIGSNVVVGAGSVVLSDITNGSTVVGNPSRKIR